LEFRCSFTRKGTGLTLCGLNNMPVAATPHKANAHSTSEGWKIIKDPIHGFIDLHPLAVKVMDTPEFQRLRDLGQLGGVYYVFAGGGGRRFEHSLGVAHLARNFVDQLRMQNSLPITDADILCVHLAGLVHDLGHGPLSHLFDSKFIKAVRPERDGWAHEHASIAMLDHLIAVNNLEEEFIKHGLDPDADVHFIKELVLGDASDAPLGFEWKVGARGGAAEVFRRKASAYHLHSVHIAPRPWV